MKRIVCIFLVFVLLLSTLASCNDENVPEGDGGDRVGDSWENVNFNGQEVHLSLSANQNPEFTFPAADIYTKGPDKAGSNEISKEVLARNKRASEELGITVKYSTTDYYTKQILPEVRAIVQTAAKTSPDVYSNDLYGLSRCMVDGLLWNVKDAGEGVKNYFDFTRDGYYLDYMKGCTFDQSKYYIFAGDYFIDMIRMAWVIYVNHDLFTQNVGKMPAWCESLDTFYEFVADGFWDMDIISDISSRVFVDGGIIGTTEKTDEIVGFAVNHVTDWVFSAVSGITLYYQDLEDNYTPKVMDSIEVYQKVADKFVDMQTTRGVYWEENVLSSTKCFLNGNVLFAISRLGEMEAEGMRSFTYAKGLTPVPKWLESEQDEYHTCVHDQAELGAILKTAKAYSAASALMQYLNENSQSVVYTYYEKGLKYKYNDDKRAREMMDIVRNSTDSPFGFQIGVVSQDLYTGTPALHGMFIEENTTCASTFASERDVYVDCLNRMIARFKELE